MKIRQKPPSNENKIQFPFSKETSFQNIIKVMIYESSAIAFIHFNNNIREYSFTLFYRRYFGTHKDDDEEEEMKEKKFHC